MSVRHASDLTVAELKEELRKLGLPGAGNKNELIMRLNESTPTGVWIEKELEVQEDTEEITNEESILEAEVQSRPQPRDARMLEMELGILK